MDTDPRAETEVIYDKAGVTKEGKWPRWKLEPPPKGRKDVGQWVWTKFETMKRYRDSKGFPKLWLRFHDMYRGKIFPEKQTKKMVPVNLVFKLINSLQANLTDNKPRADIRSKGESGHDQAQVWMSAYDTWHDRTKQMLRLSKSVFQSELYGFQVDKMSFDPAAESGMGEIATTVIDNFCIFFWPGDSDVGTTPMIAQIEAMELGEIFRRWPEAEGKVKAETEWSEMTGQRREMFNAYGKSQRDIQKDLIPPNYSVPEDGGLGTTIEATDIPRALVVELWVKDYSMEWINPTNGEKVKSKKPFSVMAQDERGNLVEQIIEPVEQSVYPGFIRRLHVTNRGKVLLGDDPNPSINPQMPRQSTANCYLFDKFPFIKRCSYDDGQSAYGLSVVEQIEPLVLEVSKKISRVALHLDRVCLPPLLLPQGCGVTDERVNNLPARIWRPVAALAQHIRFMPIPPLQSDYRAFVQDIIQLVDVVSGVNEVTEGRRPQGVSAASAIMALQEKAQTVLRIKIRNLDSYLEEQGRMFISLGQNWYSFPQKLLYQGKTGQENMVEFQGTAPEYQGEFNFDVEAGSTIPQNKWAVRDQTIKLAQMGFVDQEAVLDAFAVEGRTKIMQRMQSGVIGQALGKLKKTGMFNDNVLQAAQQILTMDDKVFKKNFPDQGMAAPK